MAYINKQEEELLLDIEQYIFIVLNFKRNSFTDEEEFFQLLENYQKLWQLNERLKNAREDVNKQAREGMRKFRSEHPEHKEKDRLYMREYNRRKKSGKQGGRR